MVTREGILETVEYVMVLVQPASREILVLDAAGRRRLPRVHIPQGARTAQQLQQEVRTAWSLRVLVLDFLQARNHSPGVAIAELLTPDRISELEGVRFDEIGASELIEEQRDFVASILSSDSDNPCSQIGWIDDAVEWIESATHRRIASKSRIEQHNAGGAFSLIRFHMNDSSRYWLKATGDPNAHELAITRLLSELGGGHLPEIISFRPAWNAWLMSGEANSIAELPVDSCQLGYLLGDAVESMAALQIKTIGRCCDLLAAGAFDQRIDVLQRDSALLFDCIEQAMNAQVSTRSQGLEKARLQEIRIIFDDACGQMRDLDLPETILHGDMNQGNILTVRGRCQFIDWCEAYVGNPLVTLQHLLLFNRVECPEVKRKLDGVLKERYKSAWLAICDPAVIDQGFLYMPLLAVVSTLYGRGDWLTSSQRDDPVSQRYARNLARHMDQAAMDSELMEALRC